MKCDQERVSKLLIDTVTVLCKNGLVYGQEMKVQGLLGITVDKYEVFLVPMNELIGANVALAAPLATKKNTVASSSNDQERISKLLTETVTLLCRNGLAYRQEMKVQGLLGITVDKNEVALVHINELIGGNVTVSGAVSHEHSSVACSPAPSNVVDLTRLADSPGAVKQSVGSPMSPGQMVARRRRCPVTPAGPAGPTMMMSRQQASPTGRMQHGLRPRMSASAGPVLQNRMSSQFGSNYRPMAQLHQQVARGMSPGRMICSPTQRPVRPRTQEAMPSHTCTAGGDDDVVIVGTGHEEPSPSWGSPMRKRPLPSAMSSSPAALHRHSSFQTPDQSSSFQGFPSVIEQLSSGDVAGALELTAEDVPTCIQDMIMEIAPITVTTAKEDGSSTELLSGGCVASANSELSSALTEDSVAMMQPDTADITATVTEDVGGLAADSQPCAAENKTQNNTESLQPVVYTDVACDVEEDAGNAESLMSTKTAKEFTVMTWDAPSSGEQKEWRCHAGGCKVVCSEASALANHYSIVHSASLDLAIPPTVIAPADSGDEASTSVSDAEYGSEVMSEERRGDVKRWPGISCPFAGCALRIASYPGLVMHHRRVHGVPLPANQRRAIATVYRAHRLHAEMLANTSAAAVEGATSVPQSTSSAVVSDSFVCPLSSCGVSCATRDDLVAHVHLSHEATDVVQPVCKQEADDSTSA